MGPSLLFFVCGSASRAVSLAEQKNSGWSGALKKMQYQIVIITS